MADRGERATGAARPERTGEPARVVTPSSLPKTKQEAAEAITRGLTGPRLVRELLNASGSSLRRWKAQVLRSRTTKSSISIADPDGGRNIRLKGAIYEQSFNAGEGLRAEIESAAAEYRRNAESRIQRAREVCQSGTERKRKRISAAIRAHEQGMSAAMQSNRLSVMRMVGRTWLTITMVSGLLFASLSGVLWYQGSLIASNLAEIDRQNAALSKLNAKILGRDVPEDSNGRFLVLPKGDGRRQDAELDGRERAVEAERAETGEGASADDRAGKTVAERIRAATAGLLEKAGRVGERLGEWRKMSGLMQRENAALSERVTRLSQQVERLSGQLQRLPVVQRHEMAVAAERRTSNGSTKRN